MNSQHLQDQSKSKPEKNPIRKCGCGQETSLLAEDILVYIGCIANWFLSEEVELVLFKVWPLVGQPCSSGWLYSESIKAAWTKWALMKRGWIWEVMGKICLKYNVWKFQKVNKKYNFKKIEDAAKNWKTSRLAVWECKVIRMEPDKGGRNNTGSANCIFFFFHLQFSFVLFQLFWKWRTAVEVSYNCDTGRI